MSQVYVTRTAHGKPIPVKITATITYRPTQQTHLLTIKARGEEHGYQWQEEPMYGGEDRVFSVYPLSRERDFPSHYTVRINTDARQDECDCPAGVYRGFCKHMDAFRSLILSGELPHPCDREANEQIVGPESTPVPVSNRCTRCGTLTRTPICGGCADDLRDEADAEASYDDYGSPDVHSDACTCGGDRCDYNRVTDEVEGEVPF